MDSGQALQLVVFVCLVLIMVAMGLDLRLADFRRVASQPKAAAVGLLGQLVLLPLLGFAFALAPGRVPGLGAPLAPELAVGIAVIVACPGSAPSNVFTYLGRGNTALSISLTAVSSLVTIVTIPLWVNLALATFQGESNPFRLPLGRTVLQLGSVTLLPIGIGMLLRARSPAAADALKAVLRRAVPWLFGLVLGMIAFTQWEHFERNLPVAGPMAALLVCVALAAAYGASKLAGLDRRDAFTVSIEVGLQNGALASLVVVNLLGRPEFMVFPGVYALLAAVPVTAWVTWFRARSRADPGP